MPAAVATQRDQSDRIAVVIPARNEEHVIAQTVRSCKVIPRADLIVVVDDGSSDRTQHVARDAGAVVVRHSVNRGKHAALETGLKVAQMRDPEAGRGRMILFLDADVGETALEALNLVEAVAGGVEMAVAKPARPLGKRPFLTRLARWFLHQRFGIKFVHPLGGERLLSPEAAQKVLPFCYGWGVDLGMTFAILDAGGEVVEVPCNIQHFNGEFPGWTQRLIQLKDLLLALWVWAWRRR